MIQSIGIVVLKSNLFSILKEQSPGSRVCDCLNFRQLRHIDGNFQLQQRKQNNKHRHNILYDMYTILINCIKTVLSKYHQAYISIQMANRDNSGLHEKNI